jgi:predicted nuclease of predicted toxin-antitoxin system
VVTTSSPSPTKVVGATDAEVSSVASSEGRLVLTLDRGFGDVLRYPPGSHAGIVVLRPGDLAPASVVATVLELVDHHDLDDLAGTVTVVQRGLLRVRRARP